MTEEVSSKDKVSEKRRQAPRISRALVLFPCLDVLFSDHQKPIFKATSFSKICPMSSFLTSVPSPESSDLTFSPSSGPALSFL